MNLPDNVVCTNNADKELSQLINNAGSKVFILVDENTAALPSQIAMYIRIWSRGYRD